jgi:hypothetical protein
LFCQNVLMVIDKSLAVVNQNFLRVTPGRFIGLSESRQTLR